MKSHQNGNYLKQAMRKKLSSHRIWNSSFQATKLCGLKLQVRICGKTTFSHCLFLSSHHPGGSSLGFRAGSARNTQSSFLPKFFVPIVWKVTQAYDSLLRSPVVIFIEQPMWEKNQCLKYLAEFLRKNRTKLYFASKFLKNRLSHRKKLSF